MPPTARELRLERAARLARMALVREAEALHRALAVIDGALGGAQQVAPEPARGFLRRLRAWLS